MDNSEVSVPEVIYADEPLAAAEPTVSAASIAEYFDETFDPYKYVNLRKMYQYSEDGLYSQYRQSYKTNPFTKLYVENVVYSVIGDGFHFEGPGAKQMEKFMAEDHTDQKLIQVLRDAVLLGNGMMDFGGRGGATSIAATRVLDPATIMVEIEIDPLKKNYGERVYNQGGKPLKEDKIFHLMLFPIVGEALGRAMIRTDLIFLQALMDAGGDSFAALKRIAYAPIVASLDLDAYRTPAEKKTVMDNFLSKLKEVESATNNFVVDKRNTISLLGTGSAGAKLLSTNEVISPWLTVVLLNAGIPVGVFLQAGANKAIIQEQMKFSRYMMNYLRSVFKSEVERKIVAKVTSKECKMVYDAAPTSIEEVQKEFDMYVKAFEKGVVSREFILDKFDIIDEGKTMYVPPQPAISNTGPSGEEKSPVEEEVENNG